ncbi:hypothetical protein AAY473_014428 [Plecturocebus cupreus]
MRFETREESCPESAGGPLALEGPGHVKVTLHCAGHLHITMLGAALAHTPASPMGLYSVASASSISSKAQITKETEVAASPDSVTALQPGQQNISKKKKKRTNDFLPQLKISILGLNKYKNPKLKFQTWHGSSHLKSQHFGRLRREDHLSLGVRDQPEQHTETPSMQKFFFN